MPASSDLFLRMSEEYYFSIPEDVRETYLRDKIYSQEKQDFAELMQDNYYSEMYKTYKAAKNLLEERAYQIREQKRKQLNNNKNE